MPDENNSNIKSVGGRIRTKLGPIVALNYHFDYGPLNHGQISLGQEHFLIKFPFFFFFKNKFSVFHLILKYVQFCQMSEVLYI